MPFDQANYTPTDPVLRTLIALKELHSDPARWCDTGPGDSKNTFCIMTGVYNVCGLYAMQFDELRAMDTLRTLKRSLPPQAIALPHFNDGMGTTHAELMAFYDKAIAARAAELETA
jgi:hypothetical protein